MYRGKTEIDMNCQPHDTECIAAYINRINGYVVATLVLMVLTCVGCTGYCLKHYRREKQSAKKVPKEPFKASTEADDNLKQDEDDKRSSEKEQGKS